MSMRRAHSPQFKAMVAMDRWPQEYPGDRCQPRGAPYPGESMGQSSKDAEGGRDGVEMMLDFSGDEVI